MRRAATLLLVLSLAVPASGCIGVLDPGSSAEDTIAATRVDPGSGDTRVLVTVTDAGQRPIEDARAVLETSGDRLEARTDASGAASFLEVPAGTAILEVRADGYVDRQLRLDVPEDGEIRQSLVLQPADANTTFLERHEFHGFFECSATYLIITGDCLVVARAALESAGVDPGDNATNERFVFPFELREGWSQVEITQTWQEPVAGAGSMMRVNLEPIDQNNTEGHGQRFARAEGGSPVTVTVENEGEPHPTASSEEMVLPEEGGVVRTRTFHLGYEDTHNPGGTEFLGAGASIQQAFTVYVNVTYG